MLLLRFFTYSSLLKNAVRAPLEDQRYWPCIELGREVRIAPVTILHILKIAVRALLEGKRCCICIELAREMRISPVTILDKVKKKLNMNILARWIANHVIIPKLFSLLLIQMLLLIIELRKYY